MPCGDQQIDMLLPTRKLLGHRFLQLEILNCCKNRSVSTSIRRHSITSKDDSSMPITDHGDFKTIYKLNHMRYIAVFSRMKVKQTALMLAGCGAMWYSVLNGSQQSFLVTTSVTIGAGLAVIVLFLISHFSRRLIGIAWLDKSNTKLKIAYLDFWGKRIDKIIPIEHVTQLGDIKQNSRNLLLKMRVRNEPEYYFYSLRGCIVHDKKLFSSVFGARAYKIYEEYLKTKKQT